MYVQEAGLREAGSLYGGRANTATDAPCRVSAVSDSIGQVNHARERVQSLTHGVRDLADTLCGSRPSAPTGGELQKAQASFGAVGELGNQLTQLHRDIEELSGELSRLSSL